MGLVPFTSEGMLYAQVPGDAEAALHRLQTKLLDVPAGAKRASREVSCALPMCSEAHPRLAYHGRLMMMASGSCKPFGRCDVCFVMQVQGAIESLKIVTGHLAAWNLPKYVHVTVEPFLRPHADYYSGAAFQVCTHSRHLPEM